MDSKACAGCRDGAAFDTPFTMAFQPMVDLAGGGVFAYEALVRGPERQGAATVLACVDETNRYAFDQQCRVKAVTLAAQLGLANLGESLLSINFLPNAVYEPRACIKLTLQAARAAGFPLERLMFEFTENERVETEHLLKILQAYRAFGFKTAIDDFGAGYAGLTLLARFQPDVVKLDMELVRGIDADRIKRALVRCVVVACQDLGVLVMGEGVETEGEAATLRELGVAVQQGYLFARPGFETLPLARLAPSPRSAMSAALTA